MSRCTSSWQSIADLDDSGCLLPNHTFDRASHNLCIFRLERTIEALSRHREIYHVSPPYLERIPRFCAPVQSNTQVTKPQILQHIHEPRGGHPQCLLQNLSTKLTRHRPPTTSPTAKSANTCASSTIFPTISPLIRNGVTSSPKMAYTSWVTKRRLDRKVRHNLLSSLLFFPQLI